MSLEEVYSTNYVVLMVGECNKMEWQHQEEDSSTKEEYKDLYVVKGMPFMEKEGDTIDTLGDLVESAKEGVQQEIIIDTYIEEGTLILIQEVLEHNNKRVGTYHDTTPSEVENGDTIYTGIVMDYKETINSEGEQEIYAQVYILNGKESYEMWSIKEGIKIVGSEYEQYVSPLATSVKLGGVIRFVVNEEDIIETDEQKGTRIVEKVDIITRYK